MIAIAAIFDMDGVLIDSIRLNWQAINEVLREYDVRVEDHDIVKYVGQTLKDQVAQLNVDYGLNLDYDGFLDRTNAIKLKPFAHIEPKEGVVRLLNELKTEAVPLAVATSMSRGVTRQRLGAAGLLTYFDFLVTEEDVVAHKPDPEIYVKAASLLHIAPTNCVVFEDAPAGVQAAKAAGMKCVAVRTSLVPDQQLSMADVIVSSLAEVGGGLVKRFTEMVDWGQDAGNS